VVKPQDIIVPRSIADLKTERILEKAISHLHQKTTIGRVAKYNVENPIIFFFKN
jgi:hypothetical protein